MIDNSRNVGVGHVLLSALALCGFAAVAHAGPPACNQAADQVGHGSGGTIGATSDFNIDAGFAVADNFSPSVNGNITELTWWGLYIDFAAKGGAAQCGPNDPPFPATENFTITYYENELGGIGLAGSPGAVLLTINGSVGSDIVKTETGEIVPSGVGDITEYQYVLTHAPVAVEDGLCYWVEIAANTTGTCFWLWQTADGDLQSMQDADGDGYDTGDVSDYDLAFCLNLPTDTVTECAAPGNNTCESAIVVAEGSTAFTNQNATTNGFADTLCDFNGDSNIGSDVYYRYDACNATVTFSICDSDFDTKMAIYAQFCPSVADEAIACVDAGCSIEIEATGNTSYFIRIGGFEGAQGSGTLEVTSTTCVDPPANDECGSAGFAFAGDTAIDTTGATNSGPDEACGNIDTDVWYRVFSASSENLTVSVTGTAFPARVAIYGASCSPLDVLACGDGSACTPVQPSTFYRIRIGSADRSTGTGNMNVSYGPADCPGGMDPVCHGDINGDGLVNVDDLVGTILCFGSDGTEGCAEGVINADSIPNGVVDVDDLILGVILNFGQCNEP